MFGSSVNKCGQMIPVSVKFCLKFGCDFVNMAKSIWTPNQPHVIAGYVNLPDDVHILLAIYCKPGKNVFLKTLFNADK